MNWHFTKKSPADAGHRLELRPVAPKQIDFGNAENDYQQNKNQQNNSMDLHRPPGPPGPRKHNMRLTNKMPKNIYEHKNHIQLTFAVCLTAFSDI